MGQRDKRHEVKQKNGSLAKLVRQQTATLSSSVRVRQEPPFVKMRQQLNWIECLTTDQEVVGSIPAQRAIFFGKQHSLVVHLVWDQGVAGSNPVFPTIYKNWVHSSAGRAPALHAGGQRFDPAWLHQFIYYGDLPKSG